MFFVIMAGGSGTRFWPLSRKLHPKQFLTIIGNQPMVRAAYERIRPLTSDSHIILVVGREHWEETERLFSDTSVHILVEPQGKNTAPCIGLAARYVEHLGSNDPLVILPADHYIAQPDIFRAAIEDAASLAVKKNAIVTLGIVPTRPETGYGYIEKEPAEPDSGIIGAHRVKRFVEKPGLRDAERHLLSGEFYWNAGIFVATAGLLLSEFSALMPHFHRGLEELTDFQSDRFSSRLASLYECTDSISFDYAIMEKTSQPVYVVPCNCGWSDVGSWYSLYEARLPERDRSGNLVEGHALALDCKESFIVGRGERFVAALGLRKVLVVDTEDALLVADIEQSQEVKKIVTHLQSESSKKLL